MKKITAFAIVTLVLLVGCNKENPSQVEGRNTLSVVMADPFGTKTSISDLYASWDAGDEILIHEENSTVWHKFTIDNSLRSSTVTAEGTYTLPASGELYGFYPYSSVISTSRPGKFETKIKTQQSIPAGQSWDKEAPLFNGWCGGAETGTMNFYSAHALVMVTLPADASQLTIFSGTALSGEVEVNQGTILVVPEHGADGSRTPHYVGVDGSFTAGNPFYVATLPKEERATDVIVFVEYTGTGPGVTTPGRYYYDFSGTIQNTPVEVYFPQYYITDFDLRKATPFRLGNPTTNFKPAATYLIVGTSEVGSCFWVKLMPGNDFKFSDIQSAIYLEDRVDAPRIVWAGADNNQNKAVLFHVPSNDSSVEDAYHVYLQINDPRDSEGVKHTGTYYLALSHAVDGAFYLVTDPDQALRFAGYNLNEQ